MINEFWFPRVIHYVELSIFPMSDMLMFVDREHEINLLPIVSGKYLISYYINLD